jgi:hypothetical protein
VIRDRSGKPILRVPNQKRPIESFGTWMTLVDWDDDGDLDILVGSIEGEMFLRRNLGTRTRPVYATENEPVMVGPKRLRVPGRGHACPVIADWDGDGRWDILTGCEDGGVYWYRNIGKRGQPRFAPPVALIPRHEGPGRDEWLDAGRQPQPGIRSQIAVVDYDGDGKLDILLGDFCTCLHVKKDLTPRQRRQLEAARSRDSQVARALREKEDALKERWHKVLKSVPKSQWLTPQTRARYLKMYQEMADSPEYKKLKAEQQQIKKDLKQYIAAGSYEAYSPATPHGHVWFFRRK